MSLNIYFLIASDRLTGAAEPALDLAEQLSLLGHNVFFCCIPNPKKNPSLLLTAKNRAIQLDTSLKLNRYFAPLSFCRDVHILSQIIDHKKIDILHCNLSLDHWIGALAARKSIRKPKVVRSRYRSLPEHNNFHYRWLYKNLTDFVFCVSEKTRKADIENLKINPEKIAVLYGSVNQNLFCLNPHEVMVKRKELGFDEKDIVVGYVARLVEHRGHWKILQIASQICQKFPRIRFLFFGRGPIEKKLKKAIARSNLQGKVEIRYFTQDYFPALACIDFGIYLCEGNDGTCRALLQQLALGKAMIVSDNGAIPEIVEDKVSGLVFNLNDTDGMIKAIERLIVDKDYRIKLGENAKNRVLNHFTPEIRAKKVIEIYQKILYS